MDRKNLVMVIAGAALLGAAFYFARRGRFNLQSVADEAEHLMDSIKNRFGGDPMEDGTSGLSNAHDGQHLASKIRHKVERMAASQRDL